MIKKSLQKLYLALIFIILYAPIVTLMVLSFNQSKTRSKWGGFTLKWYKELFQNEQIMSAFYTTLIICLSFCGSGNRYRNCGGHCHSGNEKQMAHPLYGSDKYSHDECGNCNGRVPDACFLLPVV